MDFVKPQRLHYHEWSGWSGALFHDIGNASLDLANSNIVCPNFSCGNSR
jgi:hypothetical protein